MAYRLRARWHCSIGNPLEPKSGHGAGAHVQTWSEAGLQIEQCQRATKNTHIVVRTTWTYTKSMSIFVKSTHALKPRTRDSQNIAYLYAAILIIFVLAQLFTFDNFLTLIESFWLPGGAPIAHLLGGIIVVSEVFALPFLLGMKLSLLMRVISMVLGWCSAIVWLKISLWLVLTTNAVSNIGYLGTAVRLIPGWWAVFFGIALVILSAWSSWGLWPGKRK